jgi:hypothetical protein
MVELWYNKNMRFSDSAGITRTALFSKIVLVLAAIIALATGAFASGPIAARRSDSHVLRSAPTAPSAGRRSDSNEVRPQQGHPRFQRRRPAQVIVIPSPAYYYSPYHFAVTPAVVNAPFFCLEHGVGFISRVGMIDHLGGTHKFALQHAAAICPEDVDTCIFESVWPLY